MALKAQEILAPDLALLWRVPGVDGYDGGVLPLQRYLDFLTLLIPRAALVPDGRLREQVKTMPSARLLNLLNIHYVITDKVRDLWFQGIYYDRQIGARLGRAGGQSIVGQGSTGHNDQSQATTPGGVTTIDVAAPHPFEATDIGVIAYVDAGADARRTLMQQNQPVAAVDVLQGDQAAAHLTLTAGGRPGAQLADGALDSAMAAAGGAIVAYRDVNGGQQEYLADLALAEPLTPSTLRFRWIAGQTNLVIQAVTLIDRRTGMFLPLLPSDRGRFRLVHSGDVKIYANLDALPRAYLIHHVITARTPQAALAQLRTPTFDPMTMAVVENGQPLSTTATDQDQAQITNYQAEAVTIRTTSRAPALLVLSDTNFPGWTATVDDTPTPIRTTNYLFRGVAVPAGEHIVRFHYRPQSWRRGLWLSAAGLLLLVIVFLWKPVFMRGRRDFRG